MTNSEFYSDFNSPKQLEGGVDTHAHIDLIDQGADIDFIVQRAKQAGISKIGQVFLNTDSYARNKQMFEDYPGVFFYTLGFHPHEASGFTPNSPEKICSVFRTESKIRACGEIGLDFYHNKSPKEEQIDCFKAQLELARENDWPVVIHSRESDDTALQILLDMGFRDRPLLWHCYGRELEFGELLISYGWKLSFPGTVTFKKAAKLQEAVEKLPLENMVLETDSPFLAPVPYRGKTNEPAMVTCTAQKIAWLKGISFEEVWQKTAENASAFFGLGSIW